MLPDMQPTARRMTPSLAAEIADEQIAYWQALRWTPEDAWRALGLPWAWAVEWREVRGQLIRYLLERAGPALMAA